MSRALRLEYPGAVWHVTSRGNERKPVYRDDEDREKFLAILARAVEIHGWRLHAYVLMGNHYHLLLETPETTLSQGMRQLNGVYTQYFNRRHRRSGHLFQGRFKGILVEKETHLLELVRYVVRNPLRARLCKEPGEWRWSSYRATAGRAKAPSWLQTDWTLALFSRTSRTIARAGFRRFVTGRRGEEYRPWEGVTGQIYLGDDDFIAAQARMLRGKTISHEVARAQREPAGTDWARLESVLDKVMKKAPGKPASEQRRTLLAGLSRRMRIPLSAIGKRLEIHPSYACKMASHAEHLPAHAVLLDKMVEVLGESS